MPGPHHPRVGGSPALRRNKAPGLFKVLFPFLTPAPQEASCLEHKPSYGPDLEPSVLSSS